LFWSFLIRIQCSKGQKSELERKMNSQRSSYQMFKGGGFPNKRGNAQHGLVYAKQLNEMPDYSNEASRTTEQSIGPFKFDNNDGLVGNASLIDRCPYILDNGAVYKG